MEFKFPVAQIDGKEYTADELYGKLAQEDSGHYLLSANQFWHGGVHFTNKNFGHCISDAPVQAIAEGTVVAYRINKNYLLIEDEEVKAVSLETGGYQYSSGFCLIKHKIEFKKEITEQEKQQAIQQKVQQTTDQLKDQQITVQGSSSRICRNVEGITAAQVGSYPVGTKLEIISISDAPKDNYYFAKVREVGKTATTDEHYIALLDKDGNPLKNQDGVAFFDMPKAPAVNGESQPPLANTAEPQPATFNLEFYSLYMHLCAYEDYLSSAEEEINTNITIKATNLPVRDKYRTEQDSQVIGNISTGAILKVLEKRPAFSGVVEVKAVIISGSVIKDGIEIKQVGDELIVPISKQGQSYINEPEPTQPKQRERPCYWQGTVTAKVKMADGLTIWKTVEGNELKNELGKINQGNQFTFDSTKTQTITHNNQTLLIAECTPLDAFTFRGHGEQPTGSFWTTIDKESISREQVEPTVFDTVVPCNIKVIAGENLGYLGVYETPSQMSGVNQKRQVHVEVFTPNLATVEFLLNNPFKLTGKKYIKLAQNTKLLGQLPPQSPDSAPSTQTTPVSYTTTKDHYFAVDSLKVEIHNGKEWYQIAVEQHTGYIEKQSLEEIDQHEWAKLGFQLVQETNPLADGYLDPKSMPPFFQQIYDKIDTNGDGKLQPSELKAALQDHEVRDQWSKLIAYHPSEWKKDTRAIMTRFKQLLTNILAPAEQQAKATKLLLQETQRMTTLSFLEQVAPPISPMLYHFHSVAFVEYLQTKAVAVAGAQIIFPLKVKPNNDKDRELNNYYWAAMFDDRNASQAVYGRNRNGGIRKHAARDLYTEPLTEVVAICDGEVKAVSHYYYGTWQITVKHETNDGRKFFIRYGEVGPKSIVVKVGDKVKQGEVIAKTGLLIDPKTNRHPAIVPGKTVYMLHFEYYTGSEGLDNAPPNNTGGRVQPYNRRKDIHDPLEILQEGYKNTFGNEVVAVASDSRLDVSLLDLSDKGKAFIKEWEKFEPYVYNDSKDYCSIGFGHLIIKKKCEDIIVPAEFRNGITIQRAHELFEQRLPRYVQGVKSSVTVKLYQHEFDALVSLLFNTGPGGLAGKDPKAPMLRKKLNSGDYEGAAREFLDITNHGDLGLVKRRRAENNLFLNNIYDASH